MSFKTLIHRLAKTPTALTLTAALALSAQAQANGSCNSSREEGQYFENRTNIYYFGGAHLATEQTTFTVTGNFQSISIAVSGDQTGTLCNSVASCNGLVFTAPADGTYRFEITGRGGLAIAPPLTPSGPGVSGSVVASCVAAPTEEDEDEETTTTTSSTPPALPSLTTTNTKATNATGAAATGAISTALNGAVTGGGGASVTRNRLSFATRGAGDVVSDDWTFWGSAGYRAFRGGVDGDGYELTFGADRAFGKARLGVVLSYGDYGLTTGGNAVSTRALSFGPYASVDLTDKLSLQGFVTYAQPDYTVAGTRFDANRWSGGVRLSSTYRIGAVEVQSFLSAQGFSESHPVVRTTAARTISQLAGSLGARATFTPDAALRPYLGLAGEFSRFSDGLGAVTNHISPRLGAGAVFDGGPGTFEMHLDGGEILNGTRDYGINARYSLDF